SFLTLRLRRRFIWPRSENSLSFSFCASTFSHGVERSEYASRGTTMKRFQCVLLAGLSLGLPSSARGEDKGIRLRPAGGGDRQVFQNGQTAGITGGDDRDLRVHERGGRIQGARRPSRFPRGRDRAGQRQTLTN